MAFDLSFIYNLHICLQILILHTVGCLQSLHFKSVLVYYWLDYTFFKIASVFLVIFFFSTSEVYFNLNFNASQIGQSFEYIFLMLNFCVICNI